MSLCDHEEFKKGNVHTDFIPMHKDKLFEFAKQTNITNETVCCALATILNHEANQRFAKSMYIFIQPGSITIVNSIDA